MTDRTTNHTNARTRWLLAGGLAVLMVAVAAGSFLAGRGVRAEPSHAADVQPATDEPGTDTDGDGDGGTTYYCSMHPAQRSTDPDATCPICGMAMVEMPSDVDDDNGDLPVLRVSERSAQLMNIRTAPVERRDAEVEVRFVGRLDHDERRTVDVVARSDAYIEKLHANYEWKPLETGEPLAELYSPAVTAAAREMLVVHRRQAGGRDNTDALRAARARLDRLGVSEDQVQQILDTGEVPRTYMVRSPITGALNELSGREGRWLAEGERLAGITDLSTLWLLLEAYESDLQWLSVGQAAEFTVQARPGETFTGEVAFIDPVIDPRTRTARVRLDVPNPDNRLKPGMFARGAVTARVGPDPQADRDAAEDQPPLLIPASAPLITGRRAVVYVRVPDTDRPTFEGRQVVLGPRVGDHYVVREGLEAGERVVSRGAFKIDSELQIRGRPSMMARAELFGGAADPSDDAEPRVPVDHPAHAVDPAAVPDTFAEAIAAAFDRYLALTRALASDDAAKAQQAVVDYHDHLLALDADVLEASKRDAWDAVDRELHRSLHAMFDADDLESVRAHLEPLSDYTALAVRAFAPQHVSAMYRAHCPMAFDERGADWLQTDDEIANPYFGAAMLRCGTIEQDMLDDDGEPTPRDDVDVDVDADTDVDPDSVASAYPLDVCVVSGLPLGAMGGPVRHEHDGREVRFCCSACKPDFADDPDRYLAKLDEADEEN